MTHHDSLEVRHSSVGPWPMNTYALVCPHTRESWLIDPGADPAKLNDMLSGTTPVAIVLTHTHGDHIGALDEMRKRLNVPVLAHPGPYVGGADIRPDQTLNDGDTLTLGEHTVQVVYTPGHTADMVCLLTEGHHDAIVGDTIFEGGPGRTWSDADFETTLETLRERVLTWPDDIICHPGHGPSFRLGDLRQDIAAFVARDHGNFHGDAEWK